jgi:hypothetical protein
VSKAIDWKSELPKLEREFDGLPPIPTAALRRTHNGETAQANADVTPLGVWARLALVAILAGALPFWPYARACGIGLFQFMGAGAMVTIGGLWVAVASWRCRTGFAHSLALLFLIAGLGLAALQVLPRIGYARTDPLNPPQWWCAEK